MLAQAAGDRVGAGTADAGGGAGSGEAIDFDSFADTRETLAEVVRALPAVLARSQSEAARAVEEAERLYDDYGRGPDGMKVPYVSECYRAVVRPEELPREVEPEPTTAPAGTEPEDTGPVTPSGRPPEDPGFSLIDFR